MLAGKHQHGTVQPWMVQAAVLGSAMKHGGGSAGVSAINANNWSPNIHSKEIW
jgi:hypothetical protein